MSNKPILAGSLTGPRSYFTDLDPKDSHYDEKDVERKLKLQLLTKERIVIAASSLFHNVGYKLIKKNPGLIQSLQDGVILPAVRKQFGGVAGFFDTKKEYSEESRVLFTDITRHFIPWDLDENANWFRCALYSNIGSSNSLLREKIGISENTAQEIIAGLDCQLMESGDRHLTREHIDDIGNQFDPRIHAYLNNFTNLLYRMSGARVVNSEGHFPQSNITDLGVAGNDDLVSDESIFWDIYVESVINCLSSAIRLTPERLDQLSFDDINEIRKSLFDSMFSRQYDNIIKQVKDGVSICDPNRMILKQGEINNAVMKLKHEFSKRVSYELQLRDHRACENALWQIASAIAIACPVTGTFVGCLSVLKAIPEITAIVSKPLADALEQRMMWMRNCVNGCIPASEKQKKSLLDGYQELICFGLPNN